MFRFPRDVHTKPVRESGVKDWSLIDLDKHPCSLDVQSLKADKGLALQDLVVGAYEHVQSLELSDVARVYLLDQLAQAECVEFDSLNSLVIDLLTRFGIILTLISSTIFVADSGIVSHLVGRKRSNSPVCWAVSKLRSSWMQRKEQRCLSNDSLASRSVLERHYQGLSFAFRHAIEVPDLA